MSKRRLNHEGTIYLRKDGRWCAQFSAKGKRITKYGSQRECREWLKEMAAQTEYGMIGNFGLTLNKYLPDWLDGKALNLRARTVASYRRLIQRHILPVLGRMSLLELRPTHLRELYVSKHQAGCGARTIQMIHTLLHAALKQAVYDGYLLRNPVDMVQRPRYIPQEFQIFDEAMAQKFLTAASASPFEALYYLALTTGLREGELLGLKWSDLDYKEKTLFVQRQLQPVEHQGYQFLPPKTKAGKRKVSLGSVAVSHLERHRQKQAEIRQAAGEKWREHDLIFPTTVGTPLDCGRVLQEFKRILKNAGLPNLRFHDLRHTSVSLLLEHGIPVTTVQRRVGHSKPSVTTDTYGHMIVPTQVYAANTIEALVTPVSAPPPEASNPHNPSNLE